MARRSSSARNNSSKKPSPWAEPTPAQIERSIRDSALPVVVALEIATPSETVAAARLPLLECAANAWQELVVLERAVAALERPTRTGHHGREEDTLECMVFGSTAAPELQLSPSAVNSVHAFATALVLRLQSLGFPARVVLKDRVLVRLPEGAAPANTRKNVHWDALVVTPEATTEDDAPEWIQRVVLPPVRVVDNPLAQLRHPQLLPLVDSMLEDHVQSGRVHVVVLRGIPGSGKSSLGREVVTICEARGAHVVVCSADTYFETPRGYKFDVKAISKAHEASQKKFREALQQQQAAVVVVDNTHTQQWEYDVYEQAAKERGAAVHLLEMHCPDVLTCHRMAQRNSHGVSVVKVMAMYLRWEKDDRATRFDASFEDALVLENPVTRNPLNHHVAYVGLFLDATTRAQLLERVRARHANVIAEHITLFYRPTTQYLREAPIGKTFTVRILSTVEDAKGQALQVQLDDRLPLPCMNKVPHITVSTAQGISAFYSNEMLQDPNSTRTPVDEAWEIEATLGITLMAQNHKIVTLASPFQHQFEELTDSSENPGSRSASKSWDSLVVLDVNAHDLQSVSPTEATERTLLRHALVRHFSGAHSASQRVVVVRNAPATDLASETALLIALHKRLSPSWVPDYLCFDTVVFLKAGESLASTFLKRDHEIKRITLITTESPSKAAKELASARMHVTVTQVPRFGGNDRLDRLVPALDASLTRSLDAMRVAPNEESCFTTQMAINVVERALNQCGIHSARVERVDSALYSSPSRIVEVATSTPTIECSPEDLVAALSRVGIQEVAVLNGAEAEVSAIQFHLPTKSTQTPTIRWLLAQSEASVAELRTRLEALSNVRRQLRDSLSPENQELYPRVASIVAVMLRANLGPTTSPASMQLLAERVTLAYIASHSPTDATSSNGKGLDHRVLWAQIGDCLRWLAQWTTEQWASEIHATASLTSATNEIGQHISAVFQAAAEVVAADPETMSEATGSPAWGDKLRSILILQGYQH